MKSITTDIRTDQIWAIGDVHGCAEEFREMCEKIRSLDSNAVIYQLGDLIDRGPHFYDVIKVCLDFNVKVCIGNHEMNFIKEVYDAQPCRSAARRANHDKFKSYSAEKQDEIMKFFHSMYPAANVFTGSDGEDVHWFLSHSIPHRVGMIKYEVSASAYCTRSTVDTDDLADQTDIDAFVHGHQHWNYIDIQDQIDKGSRFLNIDSGCVYGNYLLGINLCDVRQQIRVTAKEVYFKDATKGRIG